MFRVAGYIELKRGGFERVRAAGITMVETTLTEEGCHDYSFASDIINPDLIRISEGWASEDAMATHSASAHMAAFNRAMGAEGLIAADLKLYSATEVKQLLKV